MKILKHAATIVGILIVSLGINLIMPAQAKPQPAAAAEASDKYDGDCTGHETAGRCADKCPADTAEGVYYLQGYDKDTGAAVCRLEYYHACPYADSVSADDPLCAKLQAEQPTQPVSAPATTTPSNQCGGTK